MDEPEQASTASHPEGRHLRIIPEWKSNGEAYAGEDLSHPRHDVIIIFNPEFQATVIPPTVVLQHEMAHTYDYQRDILDPRVGDHVDDAGTMNAERVAVGLPIDDDGNPQTAERLDPDHPAALTENALRAEFGLPLRQAYAEEP